MVINEITRKEIENKAKLFADKGKRIIDKIVNEIDELIKRLEETKKELVEEIETGFSTNIYAELLTSIDEGKSPTDDEIKGILSKEIPSDFGPSISSFNSLREEIDSLRLWKVKKTKVNPFDLIPKNIKITPTSYDSIYVCWDKVDCECYYEVELKSLPLLKEKRYSQKTYYTFTKLDSKTEYNIRVHTVPLEKDVKSIWSDPIIIQIYKPYCGVWKKCPDYVDEEQRKYSIDVNNSRIATKISRGYCDCTIIGNTSLPLNKVTSWSIKILKSNSYDGGSIFIGVAPFDINQNEDNIYKKCGWYFRCYKSTLCSGPPHKYRGTKYGPRKKEGKYVHTGDSVGVMVNTAKGELSFAVNNVDCGIAYEGIPLDKPLVPCVILYCEGDSVELIINK